MQSCDMPFQIPARTSSFLPQMCQDKLTSLRRSAQELKRKASHLSTTSTAHSRAEYIDNRTESIRNEDDQLKVLQRGLQESFELGNLPEEAFRETFKDTIAKRIKLAAENVTISRQRERILTELAGGGSGLEPDMAAAYATIITQSFVGKTKSWGGSRTGKQQTAWGNALREWYSAISPDDKKMIWCPIRTEWGYKKHRCCAYRIILARL